MIKIHQTKGRFISMEKKYITIPYFDKYAMATDMEIIELETGEKLTEYPDAGIPYVIIDDRCVPVSFLYVLTFVGLGRFPIVPDKGGFTYKAPKDITPLGDDGYILGNLKESSEFEYFKKIPGFSQYLISPYGLIFNIDRYSFIHQTCNHNGYRTATITDDNNFRSPRKINRLVYLAYKGPIGETSSIEYINNKRWDNYCGNLREKQTSDVDSIDKIPRAHDDHMLNGGKYSSYSSVYTNPPDKINRAYKEYQYRLTPKDVTDIRERMARGEDPNKLADQYHCKPDYIRAIYKRVTWKNV